ncbi:hypothetical protein Tco_1213624 [Tanacetum coccineum]
MRVEILKKETMKYGYMIIKVLGGASKMFSSKGFRGLGEVRSREDGFGDEEDDVGEGEVGKKEFALVEFMVEWCEEDEDKDDDRSRDDDLFN